MKRVIIHIFLIMNILTSFSQAPSKLMIDRFDTFIQNEEFDLSKKYLDSISAISKDPVIIATILHLKGKLLIYESSYSKAIDYIFQSQVICKREKLFELEALNDYLLGKAFLIVSDNQKALDYLQKAIQNSYFKDTLSKIKAYYSLSIIYSDVDTNKSMKQIVAAKKLVDKYDSTHILSFEIKAKYFAMSKNYPQAIAYNQKIISDFSSNEFNRCQGYQSLGYFYNQLKSLDSSEKYYKLAVESSLKFDDVDFLQSILLKLIDVLTQQKKYEEASFYQAKYNEAITDSNRFSIEKYREIYKIESEYTSLNPKKSNLYYWIMYGGLVLFIIGIYLWKRFNPSRKEEANIKEPKEVSYFSTPELDKEILEKLNLFETNYQYLKQGISLKTLSEEFELKNQKYLSDYIRKNLEKSFRQYLNGLRIDYLLMEWKKEDSKIKNYSFDMVAHEIGFGSRSAFLKAFKEKTGKTPQEFK